MAGKYGDERCPRCQRMMIRLENYNANPAWTRLDRSDDRPGGGYYARREAGCLLEIAWVVVSSVFEEISAWRKRRKMNRLLRLFPHSLYCPDCGHVDRRR